MYSTKIPYLFTQLNLSRPTAMYDKILRIFDILLVKFIITGKTFISYYILANDTQAAEIVLQVICPFWAVTNTNN